MQLPPARVVENSDALDPADAQGARRILQHNANTQRGTEMLKDLWKRLTQSQLEIVIVLLLLTGAGALALYLSPLQLPAAVRSALLAVVSGALGGGFFAWLTKLSQIGGVIREELEKVVYGNTHLSVRNDRLVLWENATRSIVAHRFPELAGRLSGETFKAVWPADKRFYVKAARRMLDIRLVDRATSLVEITTEFGGELITDTEGRPILRDIAWTYIADSVEGQDLAAMKEAQRHTYKPLGRAEPAFKDDIIEEGPGDDPGSRKIVYRATLQPNRRYAISVSGADSQRIDRDNVTCFVATSYLDGLELCVGFDPRELNIQFFPLGNASFADVRPPARQIHKRTNDILFSDAGYLLTIQLHA